MMGIPISKKKNIKKIKEKFGLDEEIENIDTEDITDNTKSKEILKQTNIITFDKLIETLYDAGIKAQRNVQYANLHALDKFFEDKDNDGILEPKLIKVKVPTNKQDENTKWEIIEIPLFTLINHNCLKIENLKVKFNINFGDLTIEKLNDKNSKKLICQNTKDKIHKRKWRLNITNPIKKQKNIAEVEVEFKYDEPLESIVRLSERFSRLI